MHDAERTHRVRVALGAGVESAVGAKAFGHEFMEESLSSLPGYLDLLAESVSASLSARVCGFKVSITDGVPLLRIRLSYSLRGARRSMTVISGMDVLSQVVLPLLGPHVRPASSHIMSALRDALRDEEVVLSLAVRSASEKALSDPKIVGGAREEIARRSAKKRAVERTNFVSQISSLLSSGWTMEDLMSSVNEAVVVNVIQS